MHRKFIALIVATAIAVTGLSLAAAPARADDTTKLLAGLAALALIGAAIHNSRDDDGAPIVSRQDPPYYGPSYYRPTPPRPQPPQYIRAELPQFCLMEFPRYQNGKLMLGEDCLQRYYGSTARLPYACKVSYWNGRTRRTGFEPQCLQDRGFKVSRR